jgi:DNA adenine methylase
VLDHDEGTPELYAEAMTSPDLTRSLKRPIISPLRYPGGKSSLYLSLRALLRLNDLTSGTYVEPYAGGAGAAMALLITGQVQEVVINDLDPAIYAFWRAVLDEPTAFGRLIENARLDLIEWARQKEIYLTASRDDYVRLGFATFYLNRTNRSGALNGGVIGGQKQLGRYKIDARFNKLNLAERIRVIGIHAKRITVHNRDGLAVIEDYSHKPKTLIYADPPYFDRSGSLYLNSFTEQDHQALAIKLNSLCNIKWLLTYDDVPQVHKFYADRRRDFISLNYSAHRVLKAQEVMVYSDALAIQPAQTELTAITPA